MKPASVLLASLLCCVAFPAEAQSPPPNVSSGAFQCLARDTSGKEVQISGLLARQKSPEDGQIDHVVKIASSNPYIPSSVYSTRWNYTSGEFTFVMSDGTIGAIVELLASEPQGRGSIAVMVVNPNGTTAYFSGLCSVDFGFKGGELIP